MSTSKTTRAHVADRRRQALDLRAQGKTLDQIREAIPEYKSRAAVSIDLTRALDQLVKDQTAAAETLRALELERIDALWRETWRILAGFHPLVQGGKTIEFRNEETGETLVLEDAGPTLDAVRTLLRLSERRARLTGIDAPVKVDLPGTVRVEIVGIDMEALR